MTPEQLNLLRKGLIQKGNIYNLKDYNKITNELDLYIETLPKDGKIDSNKVADILLISIENFISLTKKLSNENSKIDKFIDEYWSFFKSPEYLVERENPYFGFQNHSGEIAGVVCKDGKIFELHNHYTHQNLNLHIPFKDLLIGEKMDDKTILSLKENYPKIYSKLRIQYENDIYRPESSWFLGHDGNVPLYLIGKHQYKGVIIDQYASGVLIACSLNEYHKLFKRVNKEIPEEVISSAANELINLNIKNNGYVRTFQPLESKIIFRNYESPFYFPVKERIEIPINQAVMSYQDRLEYVKAISHIKEKDLGQFSPININFDMDCKNSKNKYLKELTNFDDSAM